MNMSMSCDTVCEIARVTLPTAGPVHDALRKIAYDERVKIHDLVIKGIDAALKRRGYPPIESLKAGKKR